MLDRLALSLFRPALDKAAQTLSRAGVPADAVTLAGLALGWGAAVAIAAQSYAAAVALILASRIADGLDGPVARLTQATDRGAFIDITADFLFYASVPLGFAYADPGANALAAATLLASFIGTGASFLAFAVMAQKRGLVSAAYPKKGLYYLGGLTEGTETIACFVLMCLLPAHFALIAYVFAAMCALTLAARLAMGWALLGES
jgi:phosphatidylglycerophosphate synthase